MKLPTTCAGPIHADFVLATVSAVIERSITATAVRIAGILGAGIVVLAGQRSSRDAFPLAAHVILCTFVIIGARFHVGDKLATINIITVVIGTDLGVIAGYRRATDAQSVIADIVFGTGITIFAGSLDGCVNTTHKEIADVLCAVVEVVTHHSITSNANLVATDVIFSAGITIFAGQNIGRIDTTGLWMAGIIGARVLVVAVQKRPGNAPPIRTLVTVGTDAVITAHCLVGNELTTGLRITAIVGADIVVIAVQ